MIIKGAITTLLLLSTVMVNAQSKISFGLGYTAEKLSVQDIMLHNLSVNVMYNVSNRFSVGGSFLYGQKQQDRYDMASTYGKITAYYAPLKIGKHTLKTGLGLGYRNVNHSYLTSWTDHIDGTRTHEVFENKQYNGLTYHVQIEDQIQAFHCLLLIPHITYQRTFNSLQGYGIGLSISYQL